jgi:dTDP-4-amino-4,6-dideoxygalactose transaminase
MQIPFHRPYITDDEVNAVVDSLRNGWLTMGHKTIRFEEMLSAYVGAKHGIAVNSCTAALHLALHCIGLGAGDEVIIPTMTFTATGEVVRYFNAMPVLVDIEKDTHLMDPAKIEERIGPRTRAIIPVHYSGQPADMDEIMAIARRHNLFVIEDAAHSLPASYKGKPVGVIGDMTCFSFYATKTLATGEGGMITTDNDEWANKLRMMRLHGISRDAWKRYTKEGTWEYDVLDAGFKYNTTDVNSALGIEQMKKLEFMNGKRACIAEKYNDAFAGVRGIIPYVVKNDRKTAWHLYPLRLDLDALKIDRNRFIDELKGRDVGISVHFIPLYRFTYYKSLGFVSSDYPSSEWVFERILSLPIFPGMTDEEVNFVIENVLDIIKSNRR